MKGDAPGESTPPGTAAPAATITATAAADGTDKGLDHQKLLAKMEEANRMIESDSKSLSSLTIHSHRSSRRSSVTSQISLTSGASSSQEKNDSDPASSSGNGSNAPTEEELWTTWAQVVNDWDNHWRKRNPWTRNLIRQGVPHHFRGMVWQLLAGGFKQNEKNLYVDYIKSASACEKVIRRDIARTYPEHDFFKEKGGMGQESLFNVMKAYSLHDREVGYCQGSAFIVGLLLMQMPEEEAFAVLVTIMQKHRMRDMFKPSMAELGLCMFQLEGLIQELMPSLHQHFQAQESFTTTTFASSWFLTLYTSVLPLPLACRIMDVFLSEGMEIIFKVALALLTLAKDDLLFLDMEGMLKFLQKELPTKADADHDVVMNLAYSIKFNSKKMKKLEKEYTVIKSKEQEDMAILRCLRQENRLLKQRVELLENESIALVERLVRGQVDRAEGEEETYELTREVNALRRANVDLRQRLAVAMDDVRSLEISMAERSQDRQASAEDDNASAELAQCLQRELVRARLEAAERAATERELRARIAELEQDGRALREQHVDNSVAHLQDELIAVKLREAEANLSLKDLRQKVTELSEAWAKHLQDHRHEPSAAATSSGGVSDVMLTPKRILRAWENRAIDTQKLEEDLMSARIREMETLSEVKELRLKVMELETQVQVSSNQLRRQDEAKRELREWLDVAQQRERNLLLKQREQTHKYTDLESKLKYEQMHLNIRNVEATQRIAELEREVSEYKLKNEVMVTEGELRNNMGESDKVKELQDNVADLKAEVIRLESFKAKILGRKETVNFEDEEDEDETVHSSPFARSKKRADRPDSISQYRFSAEEFDMS